MRYAKKTGIVAFCMLVHGMSTGIWPDMISGEHDLPEIEHILSECAVLWDHVADYDAMESIEDNNSLLNSITAVVLRVTNLNRNVRNLSFSCSLDVLYHLHDIVKQISLALSQQIERCNLSSTDSARQALLMLDLLDSEFERTYYYLDTL